MIPLAVALTFMVGLLGLLVAGLLRSHADILRALHGLGAGVGDPQDADEPLSSTLPLRIGPPLPAERRTGTSPELAGLNPHGDTVAVSTATAPLTLLAFLSTGCTSCAPFWEALQSPATLGLPRRVRVVVVTKGSDLELPGVVERLAPPNAEVVMSTQAWLDYEVPGAPFFVLVDGATERRIGEGIANSMAQVVDLIRRATGEPSPHLDGRARELDNDRALLAAGIQPGDPSLRPTVAS